MYAEWDSKYETLISEIDEEHKKIITLINKLYESLLDGTHEEISDDILIEMLDYTEVHFENEEKLMELNGYHGHANHVIAHKIFKEKVEAYYTRYKNGDKKIAVTIIYLLRDWLFNHILKVDMKFSNYLAQKNQ